MPKLGKSPTTAPAPVKPAAQPLPALSSKQDWQLALSNTVGLTAQVLEANAPKDIKAVASWAFFLAGGANFLCRQHLISQLPLSQQYPLLKQAVSPFASSAVRLTAIGLAEMKDEWSNAAGWAGCGASAAASTLAVGHRSLGMLNQCFSALSSRPRDAVQAIPIHLINLCSELYRAALAWIPRSDAEAAQWIAQERSFGKDAQGSVLHFFHGISDPNGKIAGIEKQSRDALKQYTDKLADAQKQAAGTIGQKIDPKQNVCSLLSSAEQNIAPFQNPASPGLTRQDAQRGALKFEEAASQLKAKFHGLVEVWEKENKKKLAESLKRVVGKLTQNIRSSSNEELDKRLNAMRNLPADMETAAKDLRKEAQRLLAQVIGCDAVHFGVATVAALPGAFDQTINAEIVQALENAWTDAIEQRKQVVLGSMKSCEFKSKTNAWDLSDELRKFYIEEIARYFKQVKEFQYSFTFGTEGSVPAEERKALEERIQEKIRTAHDELERTALEKVDAAEAGYSKEAALCRDSSNCEKSKAYRNYNLLSDATLLESLRGDIQRSASESRENRLEKMYIEMTSEMRKAELGKLSGMYAEFREKISASCKTKPEEYDNWKQKVLKDSRGLRSSDLRDASYEDALWKWLDREIEAAEKNNGKCADYLQKLWNAYNNFYVEKREKAEGWDGMWADFSRVWHNGDAAPAK